MTELEKLAIAYAEALTSLPAAVDDDLHAKLRTHLSEKQIVELTNLIAWENARARFNRAFRIEPDGYTLRS